VLQHFTKSPEFPAECLSFLVGYFVFGIIGRENFLWNIEPFRTPWLRPVQGRMVTALLGKERFASHPFFLPTGLGKLGTHDGCLAACGARAALLRNCGERDVERANGSSDYPPKTSIRPQVEKAPVFREL
jgi:hypothetical protein